MDITTKIRNHLTQNGYTGDKLPDALPGMVWLSATTPKTSGIVKYRGAKYYFYCVRPWQGCPAGMVEARRM